MTGLRFLGEKAGKGEGTAPQRARHVQRPRDRSMTFEELRNRSVLVHRLRWAGQGGARAGKVEQVREQVRALPATSRLSLSSEVNGKLPKGFHEGLVQG